MFVVVWEGIHRVFQLFHGKDTFHIETCTLICYVNQCTGFYVIGTSVMKELTQKTFTTPQSHTKEKSFHAFSFAKIFP